MIGDDTMKIKFLLLKFYDCYCYIMDDSKNPLRHIPDPVSRFWIMTVLAWLWCIAFAIYMGSIFYLGFSFIAHASLLAMVFFTAAVFYDAETRHDSWLLKLRVERDREHHK